MKNVKSCVLNSVSRQHEGVDTNENAKMLFFGHRVFKPPLTYEYNSFILCLKTRQEFASGYEVLIGIRDKER